VHFDQIIPPREAEDMIIKISEKEKEEQNVSAVKKSRQERRIKYWTLLLQEFERCNYALFSNVSPRPSDILGVGSGIADCAFSLIFQKARLSVELYLKRNSAKENTFIFNELQKCQQDIEASFGHPLHWQSLENKKACRISYSIDFEGYNTDNWDEAIKWHFTNIQKLDKALRPRLSDIKKALKSRSNR